MDSRKVIMRFRQSLLIVLLAVLLSGCAEKGPILLDIAYQGPEEKAESAATVSVGVSPLKDVRGKQEAVLGMRTIPNGQKNDLVVKGTVAELATSILKKAL